MSPELLLILLIFVVWPLVQQWLQGRQRAPAPGPTGEAPPRPPRPAPPRPTPQIVVVESPKPAEAAPAPVKPEPATAIPARSTRHRPRTFAAELHSGRGLRRAFALAVILGPCRAVDPYSGRQ